MCNQDFSEDEWYAVIDFCKGYVEAGGFPQDPNYECISEMESYSQFQQLCFATLQRPKLIPELPVGFDHGFLPMQLYLAITESDFIRLQLHSQFTYLLMKHCHNRGK